LSSSYSSLAAKRRMPGMYLSNDRMRSSLMILTARVSLHTRALQVRSV
jgi:hypothetical protein